MPRQTIFVEFELSRHIGFPPPAALSAVDLDGDEKPERGEFIDLKREDLRWIGDKSFERENLSDLLVMIAYSGSPGARYTARVRQGKADGKVITQTTGIVRATPDGIWLWTEEEK